MNKRTWREGMSVILNRGMRPQNPPLDKLGWLDLDLHLNCVVGYTSPLLFLFERTHNYLVDKQGLLPWWLRCLGESTCPRPLLFLVWVWTT